MPTYETLFITSPNLGEDEERETVEAMAEIVTQGGGDLVANERMGRRRLAYPIRKFDDGIYVRFLYDAEPAVPHELERRIRLSDKVLRSLTVRLEQEWATVAKEEAVREAQRRAQEAIEAERAERERAAAEAAAPPSEATEGAAAESEAAGNGDASSPESGKAADEADAGPAES